MQTFLSELQRRKVLRVASGYVVAGWVILQVALSLQAAMKLPDWFSTVIVSLLIIGFPVAVVASWFFEFTPDGIRRTVPSSEVARFKPQTADFALAAALLLVLAAVGVQLTTPQATAPSTSAVPNAEPDIAAASIAVLPFADLSPAKDQEYFSDGMAEEILNVLAKVKELDVASRTSSFQFKGREIGVPEIAKQLKVRHVLEGSVRKAGTTVRITAQLIDTKTDRHLWSDTFDRPLTTDNIFAIQDEIAQAIVKALDEAMGTKTAEEVSVKPVTANLTAYDLFLQARPLFIARVNLDKADALLTRAIEQDANFARAWEMRSALQFLMVDYGDSSVPHEVAEKQSAEFANRALAIDPKSSLALAVLAKLELTAARYVDRRGDYDRIMSGFNRSLAADPRNASALLWRGQALSDVGDLTTALASFNQCLALEPYYFPCIANKIATLGALGRQDEALAAVRAGLNTGSVRAAWSFPLAARAGEELVFKSMMNSPDLLLGWRRQDELYQAFRHPGRPYPELVEDIRAFNRKRLEPLREDDLASLLIPLGATDLVPDGVEVWDAAYATYRRTAAFKARIEKSGVLDYWRKHGLPPQCRAVGTGDFECR